MNNAEVEWFENDDHVLKSQGVVSLGYLGEKLIGFNYIMIGDLVVVKTSETVLEHKYLSIRRVRMTNYNDTEQRVLGNLQPNWSYSGPWRVVSITEEGSFGITLRTQATHADILVRPDQVELAKEQG